MTAYKAAAPGASDDVRSKSKMLDASETRGAQGTDDGGAFAAYLPDRSSEQAPKSRPNGGSERSQPSYLSHEPRVVSDAAYEKN